MGIFDKLFKKEKSLNEIEKEALSNFTHIVAKTSEPVRLKGKDLLPEFGTGKLPENVRTAMMCIIRGGEKPSDVINYLKKLFVKHPDAVIFENMDIYFHAFKDLPLPNDEDSQIKTIISHKHIIEMFFKESYGSEDNIRFKVISDHTNEKCLTYSSYQ